MTLLVLVLVKAKHIGMKTHYLILFGIICAVLGALLLRTVEADIVGQARVIDGDTLEINAQSIRLRDIDTSELAQFCEDKASGEKWACGRAASEALARFIDGRVVRCRLVGCGYYRRAIA